MCGWFIKRLVECRADVVCLVCDWVPQIELVRAGLLDKVKVVRGDLCDEALLERSLGEYEVDSVIHLGAQTTVPIANRRMV
jgi:CDP-glucose 4,6-dehydratase